MDSKIIGRDVFGGILTAIGAARENKVGQKHQTMMSMAYFPREN
jgi:hypothetical protein